MLALNPPKPEKVSTKVLVLGAEMDGVFSA